MALTLVVNVTAAADGVELGVVLEAAAEMTSVPATSGRSRTAISTAAPGQGSKLKRGNAVLDRRHNSKRKNHRLRTWHRQEA